MRVAAAALPLIPDGDEARQWAERELAKPVYDIAEPTPFDRFARSVADFIASLLTGGLPAGLGPWLAVIAVAVVVAAVVLTLVIWGRPRTAARSRGAADLFGDADVRTAADLRADAARAAAAAHWDDALVLRFRALARGLTERTVVELGPGATVHRFAREAGRAFPAEADALARAADLFDDVRYLRRPATESGYGSVAALDDRLARAAADSVALSEVTR